MIARISRLGRTFLCASLLAYFPATAWCEDGPSPADALQKLQIGHARYLCGKSDHPHGDPAARVQNFAHGQHPFAAVLSCADSRAPVEMLFDQGIGDLFVIRIAGAVSDRQQLGSLEYAFEHLHTPLLVVLGHRGCGAVGAAMASVDPAGNLGSIVKCIRPAIERAEKQNPGLRGDALLAEAVKANVWQTLRDILTGSPIIAEMVQKGQLKVVGAVYDIETGTVNWMGSHPNEAEFIGGAAAARTSEGETKHIAKAASADAASGHGESSDHATAAKPPVATDDPKKPASPGPAPALPVAKSEKHPSNGHDR